MGGTPPPPLRTKFSAKRELRIWGVPPPSFTDKIRKVVFDPSPKMVLINAVMTDDGRSFLLQIFPLFGIQICAQRITNMA